MMKKLFPLVLGCVGVLGIWPLLAAETESGQPPAEPGRGRRPGGLRRELQEKWQKQLHDLRKQQDDWVRQKLGFSQEEWALVKPRRDKVKKLQLQLNSGLDDKFRHSIPGLDDFPTGRSVKRGMDADPARNTGRPQPPENENELDKARRELMNVLIKEGDSIETIKAALATFRAAQAKLQEELKLARQSLRELLSVRQEAGFVAAGVLD